MTLILVLLVLLPWSIWRQMHAHAVTRESLIKLPLIFAAVGALGFGTGAIPTDGAAVAYLAFSAVLSVGMGVWRGTALSLWRDDDGTPISEGNHTTIALWIALIGTKVALGTIASITGWFPAEHAGEIFLFLSLSFVAQNLVVARRTGIWSRPRAAAKMPGMGLSALILGVAVMGATALAASPAQAAPTACPGTFQVLHNDTIGFASVPAGNYQITTLDPSALSCASAGKAFTRFLQDFDGKLPAPWRLNALSGTFTRGSGPAAFEVALDATPTPPPSGGGNSGGGGTYPEGNRCGGTFRVLHNDRVGRLKLPAGRYRITLGPSRPVSCKASSRAFARFLARPDGSLPSGWSLNAGTGTFSRNGAVAFRIKPTVAAVSATLGGR